MTTTLHLVSPADIQSELNRIWESLETKNVARACLFNLVFYTKKNSRTPYIQRLAQKVIEKFPSRVIFVTVDDQAAKDCLKTEVSILSSSKGEFDVACDYIQIETGGSSQARIPFLILPHILADLPVYLIWGDDPCNSDSLFSQLEPFANRLIFDSETTGNLSHYASSVLEQHEKFHSDIADLNWARIESWREMFSMAFHSKDNLSQMMSSKSIKIAYNCQETPFFCHTPIQALYLQAWLACQLEWKFKSLDKKDGNFSFSYETTHGPLEIALSSSRQANLPPGLILSAEITTADEEHFSFQRHPEILHQITYQHSTKLKCNLPSQYILTRAESGHSLVKEICHRGTSEHFLKVLNLLKKMDNSKLC